MRNESDAVRAEAPDLCDYAAAVTAERLDRMLTHIDGVRKGDSPGPVHQMRVWSRRSRAALEIFRVCFTGRAFAEIEREVKAATDALSEARDLDVMIENLLARSARLPASQRAGIESFVARLKEQREARQDAVARAVTDLESHHLAQRFRDLTDKSAAERAGIILQGSARKQPATRRARKASRRG
jgi:CHAD domain-containing protein